MAGAPGLREGGPDLEGAEHHSQEAHKVPRCSPLASWVPRFLPVPEASAQSRTVSSGSPWSLEPQNVSVPFFPSLPRGQEVPSVRRGPSWLQEGVPAATHLWRSRRLWGQKSPREAGSLWGFKTRPHSRLRSSQNARPGASVLAAWGRSSFWPWVHPPGGVLGLEVGPREDGHAV